MCIRDSYYVRDILQNILGIVDSNGTIVVKYDYNAFGKLISITGDTVLGNRNPFKWKGYYYDTESEMYYCKSRYYIPAWCRWLNADSYAYLNFKDINGSNLFVYCNNNPIMFGDETGNLPKWVAWALSVTAIVVGVALCATGVGGAAGSILLASGAGSLIGGYVNEANGGSFTAGYIGGAVTGALCGYGAALGASAISSAVSSKVITYATYKTAEAVAYCFVGGMAGTYIGNSITAMIDSSNLDENLLNNSIACGALNIISAIGGSCASSGTALGTGLGKTLSGIFSVMTESTYDLSLIHI